MNFPDKLYEHLRPEIGTLRARLPEGIHEWTGIAALVDDTDMPDDKFIRTVVNNILEIVFVKTIGQQLHLSLSKFRKPFYEEGCDRDHFVCIGQHG